MMAPAFQRWGLTVVAVLACLWLAWELRRAMKGD